MQGRERPLREQPKCLRRGVATPRPGTRLLLAARQQLGDRRTYILNRDGRRLRSEPLDQPIWLVTAVAYTQRRRRSTAAAQRRRAPPTSPSDAVAFTRFDLDGDTRPGSHRIVTRSGDPWERPTIDAWRTGGWRGRAGGQRRARGRGGPSVGADASGRAERTLCFNGALSSGLSDEENPLSRAPSKQAPAVLVVAGTSAPNVRDQIAALAPDVGVGLRLDPAALLTTRPRPSVR